VAYRAALDGRPQNRRQLITAVERGYIDLKPGWLLRVVTPILKSGGYRLPSLEKPNGPFGALSVGPDFIGYEVSLYRVKARKSALHIQFRFCLRYVKGGAALNRVDSWLFSTRFLTLVASDFSISSEPATQIIIWQ